MRNVQRLVALFVFVAAVSQIASCRKIHEEILENPTADIKVCNIQSIYFNANRRDTDAKFYYNRYGNPDSVIFSRVGTGNPNIIVRYDDRQRMTDLIQPYNNLAFERWQKFSYDSQDRIISETFYGFGFWDEEPTRYFSSGTVNYEYDAYGRISKAVTNFVGSPEITQQFEYDARGNLARPGVTYDNKINLHRTNKIWMFIDRDYSLNNPFSASDYNTFALPVEIGELETGYPMFLGRPISESMIRYLCDRNKGAQ